MIYHVYHHPVRYLQQKKLQKSMLSSGKNDNFSIMFQKHGPIEKS